MSKHNPLAFQDEINLAEYVYALVRWKWLVVLIVGLALAGASVYNRCVPPSYIASASFFIPIEAGGTSSASAGYIRLLGVDGGSISSYIGILSSSHRIQELIADDLYPEFKLPQDRIIGLLKLGKNLKLTNNGNSYNLTYENSNPAMTVKVIESYTKNLILMNQYYNISPQKEIIVVLDKAKLPRSPTKPRRVFNLAIAGIGSLGGSILLILLGQAIVSMRSWYKDSVQELPK